MKKVKLKILLIITVISIVIPTTFVVHAQELSKQKIINNKLKQFINSTEIDIIENYEEEELKVYKIHDIISDKYYKLAIDTNNKVDWYAIAKYGKISKIDVSLKDKMDNMSDDQKVPIIVELIFDYTSIDTKLGTDQAKYFNNSGMKSNLTSAEIADAKAVKKKYTKEVMTTHNKLDKKYEVLAISEYSPFLFLNLTKKEINELLSNDKVFGMGLFPQMEQEIIEMNSSDIKYAINNNPIFSTRTNEVKNAGITGSGIKIGQIEMSNPNTNNTYLVGKSIIKRTTDCSSNPLDIMHATEVAGIMVGNTGIAPNATLYSACYYGISVPSFALSIDWLISQNVDIINMSSWMQASGSYNTMDRWIDAITHMNDVLFIKSSGNANVDGG